MKYKSTFLLSCILKIWILIRYVQLSQVYVCVCVYMCVCIVCLCIAVCMYVFMYVCVTCVCVLSHMNRAEPFRYMSSVKGLWED